MCPQEKAKHSFFLSAFSIAKIVISVAEVKANLQELFSTMLNKSTLESDSYLQAHVTAAGLGVPLAAFLEAPQVQAISRDTDLVRIALMESKTVYIHGEDDTVRAIVKPEQNTLILRDIPSDTATEDIADIFVRAAAVSEEAAAGSGAGIVPTGIRADMNDTW